MGQLALGLRSLAVRLAVFVAMAALLAWALGGTLFPSPQRVNLSAWSFDGSQWNWRVSGSGSEPQPVTWTLVERRGGRAREERFGVAGAWRDVRGPRFDRDAMLLAVETHDVSDGDPRAWWLIRVETSPERRAEVTRLESAAAMDEVLCASPASPSSPG